MATFALGTAAGDMSAVTLHLGYFSSGLMFAGIIAIPAVGYWKFHLNPILGFWFAYIVTRPLGASFADWLGVSHARGGLNLGPGPVSLGLATLIIMSVAYLTVTGPARHGAASDPAQATRRRRSPAAPVDQVTRNR
jgi:uncharacterized membrane-anchored protein